ncbi:MAG: ethanolamine ammonia-lyase light chain EutC, partial [Deltaproteobacteria bacterium]|nr:ethanolamine ammonia-lyase light chain EutC [Deltaproteobacteria bacterium]
AHAITDKGHLTPYLSALREQLLAQGLTVAKETLVVHNGRVRTGYRIGELLFGKANSSKRGAVIHVIGERPGTGHHNLSAYIIAPTAKAWKSSAEAYARGEMKGQVDHDTARLVSGISDTAFLPRKAAEQTAVYLKELRERP